MSRPSTINIPILYIFLIRISIENAPAIRKMSNDESKTNQQQAPLKRRRITVSPSSWSSCRVPAVIFGEKKLERQLSYGMYTDTLLCRGRVTDAIEAVSVYV